MIQDAENLGWVEEEQRTGRPSARARDELHRATSPLSVDLPERKPCCHPPTGVEYAKSFKVPYRKKSHLFKTSDRDGQRWEQLFPLNITLDKSWGYLQSDGTMDGLVGDLQRRKIDFGLSPLFVKKDRLKFISYGRRTYNLR
ncbi:hypothetical protein YQE_04137, partial [Dendroctonus ponderosae]